jgi:hypothetical protein
MNSVDALEGILYGIVGFGMAVLPVYLVWNALRTTEDRRKMRQEIRDDSMSHILLLAVLIGWFGFGVWMGSSGKLSSGYSGVLALAAWVASEIWDSQRRRKR